MFQASHLPPPNFLGSILHRTPTVRWYAPSRAILGNTTIPLLYVPFETTVKKECLEHKATVLRRWAVERLEWKVRAFGRKGSWPPLFISYWQMLIRNQRHPLKRESEEHTGTWATAVIHQRCNVPQPLEPHSPDYIKIRLKTSNDTTQNPKSSWKSVLPVIWIKCPYHTALIPWILDLCWFFNFSVEHNFLS